MFKLDWPCAIGGAILGYYTKGKVTAAKETFKKVSMDAMETLKESFSDCEPENTQGQGKTTAGGKKNGN